MGFLIYKSQSNKFNSPSPSQALITNFEECVNAGNLVMESYPRQCRTQGGELFVENVVAPNPTSKPIPTSFGYVSGHVTIGPLCPGPIGDRVCNPSPEVYTSREAVVYASDGTTIKERVHLDAKGDYKISLTPGNYFIQIQPAGIRSSEKKPATVKSNQTTVVDLDIDTGIR